MKTQTVKFLNWSTTEFQHKWDGENYIFAPGESMYLEAGIAETFAYHLSTREMQKKWKQDRWWSKESPEFLEFMKRCVVSANTMTDGTGETKARQIIASANEEKKTNRKKKEKTVEPVEEFEGLKEEAQS